MDIRKPTREILQAAFDFAMTTTEKSVYRTAGSQRDARIKDVRIRMFKQLQSFGYSIILDPVETPQPIFRLGRPVGSRLYGIVAIDKGASGIALKVAVLPGETSFTDEVTIMFQNIHAEVAEVEDVAADGLPLIQKVAEPMLHKHVGFAHWPTPDGDVSIVTDDKGQPVDEPIIDKSHWMRIVYALNTFTMDLGKFSGAQDKASKVEAFVRERLMVYNLELASKVYGHTTGMSTIEFTVDGRSLKIDIKVNPLAGERALIDVVLNDLNRERADARTYAKAAWQSFMNNDLGEPWTNLAEKRESTYFSNQTAIGYHIANMDLQREQRNVGLWHASSAGEAIDRSINAGIEDENGNHLTLEALLEHDRKRDRLFVKGILIGPVELRHETASHLLRYGMIEQFMDQFEDAPHFLELALSGGKPAMKEGKVTEASSDGITWRRIENGFYGKPGEQSRIRLTQVLDREAYAAQIVRQSAIENRAVMTSLDGESYRMFYLDKEPWVDSMGAWKLTGIKSNVLIDALKKHGEKGQTMWLQDGDRKRLYINLYHAILGYAWGARAEAVEQAREEIRAMPRVASMGQVRAIMLQQRDLEILNLKQQIDDLESEHRREVNEHVERQQHLEEIVIRNGIDPETGNKLAGSN